jgi:hypothetical protein
MSRRWLLGVVLAGVLLAGWACGPRNKAPVSAPEKGRAARAEDAGPPLFRDITKTSGIDFTYRNGEEPGHLAILESLGGGVGVIDFDGDGLLDLFLVGGGEYTGPDKKIIAGRPCKLYRNLGGGKFKDVTREVGLDRLAGEQPWFYTHGVAVGDYDRDGWPDLLVTGWGRVVLFHNVPVDPRDPSKGRRFEDVTEKAGLGKGITWATSAGWADLDGDGYPDLYICQYVNWSWANHPSCTYDGKTHDVCPPKNFSGLEHKVFLNKAGRTFEDVSATVGLAKGGPDSSKGLGVLIVDVNGDGKPDVYVANDTVDKFLYLNRSTPGKILFEEMAMKTGVARDDRGSPNGSMGLDAGDYDGRGLPSLWVTNYENELHALYQNQCKGNHLWFSFQTTAAGIAAIGQKYVGWGTSFIDFDLDGWEDIFVSNGHAIRYPTGVGVTRRQKPIYLHNLGGGKFVSSPRRLGEYGESEHLGRGVGFIDLDNDGKVDVVLNHMNEPVTVLHNIAPEGNHWLGVQLVGKDHADVVGARVVLAAGDRQQTRFAKGGGSYASSSDRRLVYGLGKTNKVERVTVIWPNGDKQEWTGLAIDHYHRLVQGKEDAEAYPGTK